MPGTPGFPPGVFLDRGALDAPVSASYQGPGDVVSGASMWASPARAYSATFAAGGTNIADIVDTSTGLATCSIPIGANGFANLTATVCPTGAPAVGVTTFCTVTHTGCSITKLYDQTGNGHDFTQATLANMPLLSLSSINGLPAVNCGSGASISMQSAGTVALTQPYSFSAVAKRTAAFTAQGGIFGVSGSVTGIFGATSANNWFMSDITGTNLAATDSSYHGFNGLYSGASSFYNLDGSDNSISIGSGALGATTFRFCRAGGSQFEGVVAEGGFWASTGFTLAQRGNLFTNMNGVNGYNGAL
jgi:hypothetical protein